MLDLGTASITEIRRSNVLNLLDSTLDRRPASALELVCIAGHLIFVTRVCPAGRAFLRRIYDAGHDLSNPDRRSIPHAAQLDLRWWRDILRDWNSVLLLDPIRTRFEIWSDASSTIGMGGHLGPINHPTAAWSSRLSPRILGNDIMTLEALALLECLDQWRNIIHGDLIVCYVDNTVLEAALLSGSCRHRPTQSVIRAIFHFCSTNDVVLAARWIPSEENKLADALFRLAWTNPSITPHVTSLLHPNNFSRFPHVPFQLQRPSPRSRSLCRIECIKVSQASLPTIGLVRRLGLGSARVVLQVARNRREYTFRLQRVADQLRQLLQASRASCGNSPCPSPPSRRMGVPHLGRTDRDETD